MLIVLRKKRRSISLYSSYFKIALKLFQNQIICVSSTRYQTCFFYFFVFYSGTPAKSNLRYQKLGKTIEDKESMTLKMNGAICQESLAPNSRSLFSCRKQLKTHLNLEAGYKLPHNKFSTTNITSSKKTRSSTNIKRKKIEKYITAAWHRSQARSIFLHM